ncbi:dihydroneopterin aldolase [Marinospirillum sp. MEB164]|uniref:7,8-dihydroneopterin aldolase n=1 Tax=Marinospirillum alkalitolerans TaxID=3123374 RepID=A0ABW8PW18_9GAMM
MLSSLETHDQILIDQLRFEASLGLYEWEKNTPQPLSLDACLYVDLKAAAAAEDLSLSVDYAQVSQELMALAQAEHHDLVETLIEKMAQHLLQQHPITAVQLTLRKLQAVPQAQGVGARIFRQRATS